MTPPAPAAGSGGPDTCFVIMPFGIKQSGSGGRLIDFDQVHHQLIQPAVARVPGLRAVRCDELERPGWIHERMLAHIFQSRVAIVDLSALNANVFYELGVRHALCRGVTVLIQEDGTTTPFNLAGMDAMRYTATPEGLADKVATLARYIDNGLSDTATVDSLVHKALPQLQVRRVQRQAPYAEPLRWRVAGDAVLGFATGDRRDLVGLAEAWVSSENTQMQMDSVYGKSTSATLRYLGARTDEAGAVVDDTVADALRAKMRSLRRTAVDPATVLETTAGQLQASNGVRWLLHVAAVVGQPLQGWQPVKDLAACTRAPLRKALALGARSVLMPLFGTGPGGGDVEATLRELIDVATAFLELPATRQGTLREVYFYVWGEDDLDLATTLADGHPRLQRLG